MIVNVPGYGPVKVDLQVECGRDEDGKLVAYVTVDIPTPPGDGGEPLPVAA